ncbi:phage tail tape measure family protein [Vibrio cholerae]|nr:phage tail tape measure family protein [Vibrio cholerae]
MIDSLLGESIPGYRELDAKFTTKMKAFFGDKEAQEQDVKYYGADPSKYTVKPMTPPSYMVGGYGGQGSYLGNSYMAGQTGGEMKLKVEVSDDRVKVTPTYLPKGFTIDPDVGAN